MGYTAAIFDMDGTILDTLEDLATSLDTALKQTGHKHTFSCRDVGSFFGSGAQVAVMRALATEAGLASTEEQLEAIGRSVGIQDLGLDEAEVERVRSAFAVYYRDHCNDHTQSYPGILGLLSALRQSKIVCAVVSNKMDPEVRRLADLHFPGLLDISVGERSDVRRKPAPDAVLRVAELLKIEPREAVYIGDSEIDLLTAQNANIPCIAVSWGFRSRAFLERHNASLIADNANELAELIFG